MTNLIFKNFIRSKSHLIGLGILLITGLISLQIGKNYIETYQQNINKTAHFQQETINRYVKFENKEMGLLLYYLKFGLVNEMPNIAGLSIGQRDINPDIMNVTIRFLEEQKYNTKLSNPMYQLLGNLDFSFVLIYFFPLIIISFCFNIISEEKENGTWNLIKSQTSKPINMLLNKLLIRFLAVFFVLMLLLIIAKFYLQIPLDNSFLAFGIACIFYILFWFSVCWLVVSFYNNSKQNALILLMTWLGLTVIFPALLNILSTLIYPIPEASQTVITSREGYHGKWDEAKQPTIDKFKKHYPQFNDFQHPADKDFSWLFYYAMQQMGDDDAASKSQELKQKIKQRINFTQFCGLFIPTVHTQVVLNQLSLSDMDNQINFWKATEDFHEQKRLHFYPKIFSESPVLSENWKKWKLEYFKDALKINWLKIVLPMLIISIVCSMWASLKLRNL